MRGHPGGPPHEEPGRVGAHLHVGQLEGDGLVLDDRPAELPAVLGVAQRVLVGGAGDADRLGADGGARRLEHRQGWLHPGARSLPGPGHAILQFLLAAEQATPRHPAVIEDHLGGVRGYYLITAYGEGNDQTKAQQLLGKAMSVLHDHPLLGSEEIKKATETNVAGSNLHEQIERVRITPHPLSLEEMSKMWTMFQTQYRISAAYEVSVVLIESTLPTRAALPVLTRGKDDAGVQTLLGKSPLLSEVHVPLTGKFDPSIVTPTAQGIQLVKALPSAQPGDELALLGQRLAGDYVRVVFERQRTGETFEPNIVKRSRRQSL